MTAEAGPILVTAPQVALGPGLGTPLAGPFAQRLSRALVETHLHLPGMFELSFVGVSDTDLQQAGIVLGARASIASSATAQADPVRRLHRRHHRPRLRPESPAAARQAHPGLPEYLRRRGGREDRHRRRARDRRDHAFRRDP
jgi:hypothetical protein